jgi:membrane protein
VGQLSRNFPVYTREIRGTMLRVVEMRAASGVLGFVTLIAFSTPLFSASRLVLHRLLGVRAPRELLRNFVVDAGTALLLGLLLFGATVVTWGFHWLQTFVLEPAVPDARWVRWANVGFSVSLSAAMFYLAYRYVPRRGVRPLPALIGAIVASGLWEIAKQLFTLYIRKFGVYDQIYGPLGVLVAFVMFMYYSAVVFVFGGAYVAALQSRRK